MAYLPIASIDVGSNTIRLLIGRISRGKLVRTASCRAVTRLGKDTIKTCLLNKTSINRSVIALKKFKAECDKFGVTQTIAVGTSALREARNSREFLEAVRKKTGISINIISGKREAELTAKGVMQSINHKQGDRNVFIIDIGGGSTEWILFKEKTKLKMGSMPVGAVKLYEAFIKHDPPLPEELAKTRDYILTFLTKSLRPPITASDSPFSFIATGGTPATLAAVEMGLKKYDGNKVHMRRISKISLKAILDNLSGMTLTERKKTPGMEQERADIIISGMIILATIMEHLNVKKVIVSDYGILEGLLFEKIQL